MTQKLPMLRTLGFASLALILLPASSRARAQAPAAAEAAAPQSGVSQKAGASADDLAALVETVDRLQAQVGEMNSRIGELQAQEIASRHRIAQLEQQLADTAASAGVAPAAEPRAAQAQSGGDPSRAASVGGPDRPPASALSIATNVAQGSGAPNAAAALSQTPAQSSVEGRLARVEDDLGLANAKISEQAQTKVESGSKYRVRLSGMVLLNAIAARGLTDNLDFPAVAVPASSEPIYSGGAFGGSLRQSLVSLETFGPDIAGARTSANLRFDFAGGFPSQPNGAFMGVVRLRTGTIRLDWDHTSLIAGQDSLFFAPQAPSSLASVALPPLAYAGNLWAWAPQIRIEHTVDLSESSKLLLQAGVLDNLTGDVPNDVSRDPQWGEQAGQPAYAARISWTRAAFGQDVTFGAGGLFSPQSWGVGRDVSGWAGTADVSIPLGPVVTFSGGFYRGRAVGGFGGAIGQSILLSGPFQSPTTSISGLDAMGGWAQLQIRATPKLQFNAALGDDNPFASELDRFPGMRSYFYANSALTRNFSPLFNFIYQPRSDMLFSAEYRWLRTTPSVGAPNSANLVNLSLGYLF